MSEARKTILHKLRFCTIFVSPSSLLLPFHRQGSLKFLCTVNLLPFLSPPFTTVFIEQLPIMIFRCSLGVFSHFQTPPLRWPSDRVLTLSRFATIKECKMWGCHSGADGDASHLGYDTVSLGEWFLKFEKTVGPLCSNQHKGTTVLLSIGNTCLMTQHHVPDNSNPQTEG